MKPLNAVLLIIPLLLLLTLPTAAQDSNCKDINQILKAQDLSVKKSDVYESAEVCAVCHDVYYNKWKSGLMGKTHTSELYRKFLGEAIKNKGSQIEDDCRICHTPLYKKSENASDELLAEGVNCDFCHTISQIEFYRYAGSYISSPSRIKKGSLDVAKSPYHPTAKSNILENPRYCASCHEYEIQEGGEKIIIEDTYTQYMDSSYGRTERGCIACHLPEYEGKAANLDLAPSRGKIHDHSFAFKNKQEYIKNAASLIIKPFIQKAADVTIVVNNQSQGHAFPGGANYFRQAILTVKGYDGDDQNIWTYSYVFGRWYEDRFKNVTYFPWLASKMVYNKLLRPDRMEEVKFNLTEKIKLYKVRAYLDYWEMPPDLVKKHNLSIQPIRISSAAKDYSD